MKRINALAKMVPDNSRVIDIGCDHGYLGIELINENRGISVISSDISSNALQFAKKNILQANVNGIDLRVGNGLSVVTKNEIDTIVIAGMGAHTQIEILKSGLEKLDSVKTIILSPNDGSFYIRNNLNLINYHIEDEEIIFENGKFYTILKLCKGFNEYTYAQMLMGPVLLKKQDELFFKYYETILTKKEKILENLPKKYSKKISLTKKDVKIIKKYLRK